MLNSVFTTVRLGLPLPPSSCLTVRDRETGQTLLHVAAACGRYDAVWHILQQFPKLAGVPDFSLKLPEDVAMSERGRLLLRHWRLQIYTRHEAV
tara:strand:+ start:3133 stop:3414 length:282 start_codon:yes stop_codon:yes gene_type:complete